MWGACVTCTRVKVLGVGRKSYLYTCEGAGCGAHLYTCAGCGAQGYLYTCEGAGCGAQELPVHVRRCWVWGARVTCTRVKVLGVGRITCTRVKVLGVGRKSYLYTCEGAGCGAHYLYT